MNTDNTVDLAETVIQLEHVDLLYKTNQSLSIKSSLLNMIKGKKVSHANEFQALKDISLDIRKGKVYGVIGNNGAGKSTLLKVLSGVMSPNRGIIHRNFNTINLLALGLGFSRDLSGRDNILLNGLILGFTKEQIRERLDSIIQYSELGSFIDKQIRTYSSGMVSRLGFSIAIHLKPDVLLIDEILSVGDIGFRQKSFNSIKELIMDETITVVIVSHSLEQLRQLCNEIIWMEKGRIVECGNVDQVLENYQNKTVK